MADPTHTDMDPELDSFFAAARENADTALPGGLHARILSDAAEAMPPARSAATPLWRRIWDDLGGLPLATGLATATLAGLWIGGASPSMLDTLLYDFAGQTVTLDTYFLDVDSVLEGI